MNYQIPSPGQYLKDQHDLYNYEDAQGSDITCFMIAAQTNSFIDALIRSDVYHEQRMEGLG